MTSCRAAPKDINQLIVEDKKMSRTSGPVRSFVLALVAGAAMSVILLAGCDSASVSGPSFESAVILDGFHAQTRVDVCHVDGKGEYSKITVSEASYDSHVAHGDGAIGSDVPGMEGYKFNEECQPVVAECPCFSATPFGIISATELSDYETEEGWRTQLYDIFSMDSAEVQKVGDNYSCSLRGSEWVAADDISRGAAEMCRAILLDHESWDGGW
jgi:hypothetical protein